MLRPTFSIEIGNTITDSDNPVGGPTDIFIERDMDIAADLLNIKMTELEDMEPGDPVTASLGFDDENSRVFIGNIVSIRPSALRQEIIALGKMNDLMKLFYSAVYENQSAGSIVQDIIGQAGLSAGAIDEGPTLPVYNIDNRLNGYRHVKDLADRLGYELYTNRDGEVNFHALGESANLDSGIGGMPELSILSSGEGYSFGQHLINVNAKRDPIAWSRIDVGGESPMSGQGDTTSHWLTANDTDYRGSSGSNEPAFLINDPAARTKDLADRFAEGRLAITKRTAHLINFTTFGRPQPDLGDAVNISDVPKSLANGAGYIRAIRHKFSRKYGFISEFTISVGIE